MSIFPVLATIDQKQRHPASEIRNNYLLESRNYNCIRYVSEPHAHIFKLTVIKISLQNLVII